MQMTTIRVIYPSERGTISLATEPEWRIREPDRVSPDGNTSEFDIFMDGLSFEYKPVRSDGQWATGTNYRAGSKRFVEIYPSFEGGDRGHLFSKQLDTHRVSVYLPAGWHENTLKKYPLIVMQDGGNLFAAHGDTPEWEIDENLDTLNAWGIIDKVVIVGVHPNDREREYTPAGWEDYRDTLIGRILPQLKPLRLLGGPKQTFVMGSSLGGLVSFYLAWDKPEVFGGAASLSGSFWVITDPDARGEGRNDLERRLQDEEKKPIRIYQDSGLSGIAADNAQSNRQLREELLEKGYEYGRDYMYLAFPLAEHNESYWAARTAVPIQFLLQSRA